MTGGPRRYRYRAWHGGPDPLSPPLDLPAALEELGQNVLGGASFRQALAELLRTGTEDRPGLDDLSRRVWQRRAELLERHGLDGTVARARELLTEATEQERAALAEVPTDDARLREMELDALATDTVAATTELSRYRWQSPEASETFRRLRNLLGAELLEQRFRGVARALRESTPSEANRVRRMLDDLSMLLAAHQQGTAEVARRFEELLAEYRGFFPENPRDVDELIDTLAARSAAASRLRNSMSEQQQVELWELSQHAFGDPRLAQSLHRLDEQLHALRPAEEWTGSAEFHGDQPLGWGAATGALVELGALDRLAEQLGQDYPGARLEDIDLDALRDEFGEPAVAQVSGLAELESQLHEQGYVRRGADGVIRLSPVALRRLGEAALRSVLTGLRSRHGERDGTCRGGGGEPTGTTRGWRFGDSEPWDAAGTVHNAVLRRAGQQGTGSTAPMLEVADIAVTETEPRARAAVAMCVDTSWSMVADGRWLPMKRTALALHHLVSTRYRSDSLQLITFGRHASTVELSELAELEGTWEQGTNLHHALVLAGHHLRRNLDAQPVVLVVTDGEPTAHVEPNGAAVFDYPPTERTLAVTLSQVDSLSRMGATLSVFMLGDDERLAAFVDLVARRGGGRVIAPTADGLGAAVVSDYLHFRRR